MTTFASSYHSTSTTCAPQLFNHANPTAPQSFLELLLSPVDSWSFDNSFLPQLPVESGWSSDSSSINLFGSGDGVVANAVELLGGGVDDTSPAPAPLWSTQLPYLPSQHPQIPTFPSSCSSQLVTMSNTNDNRPHEPTSPKRSAADDEDFGREAHADKKARVSIEEVPDEETSNQSCQLGVDFNSDCALFLSAPGFTASPPPTETVTKVDIPPPPRSPSPPRHLGTRPAVPSPLSPPAPPCISHQRPQPTRRRSRSNEIGLLKFALDPWLRLSRTLEPVKNSFGGGCRSFNPATFPRAGNLRELRGWNRCGPFGNGVAAATNHISFGVDVLTGLQFCEPEPVKWNLVDA